MHSISLQLFFTWFLLVVYLLLFANNLECTVVHIQRTNIHIIVCLFFSFSSSSSFCRVSICLALFSLLLLHLSCLGKFTAIARVHGFTICVYFPIFSFLFLFEFIFNFAGTYLSTHFGHTLLWGNFLTNSWVLAFFISPPLLPSFSRFIFIPGFFRANQAIAVSCTFQHTHSAGCTVKYRLLEVSTLHLESATIYQARFR